MDETSLSVRTISAQLRQQYYSVSPGVLIKQPTTATLNLDDIKRHHHEDWGFKEHNFLNRFK